MLSITNFIKRVLNTLGLRPLLIILTILTIIYSFTFFLYINYNNTLNKNLLRNKLLQQIVNVAETINMVLDRNQLRTSEMMQLPNLTISLTNTPKNKVQFPYSNFTQLDMAITDDLDDSFFSIQLKNKKWLNFHILELKNQDVFFISLLGLLQFVIIFSILFSIWVISRFSAPLRKFKRAAERLGVDLHAAPLDKIGPPLIQDTANAMNKMQERIQELIADRTQMLASISHDLRTPITRLKLRAHFVTDQEQQKKMINDLDEMEFMIKQTLVFVRTNYQSEVKIRLDLSSLILSVCDDLNIMGNSVIEYSGPVKGVVCLAQPIALKRALVNIIDNAIKYSDGKQVKVNLQQNSEKILLTIDDNGPGLPENILEKVFLPFYRYPLNTRHQTGFGLGLSIVREVIKAHLGTIKLLNRLPHGLRVQIEFVQR